MPVQRFIDDVQRAVDPRDISNALLAAVEPYGFTCVALGRLPDSRTRPPLVALGWPQGWIERFLAADCHATDPVLVASRTTTEPFVWSQARRATPPTAAEWAMIDEARAHGIFDGLAIPIIGLDGAQWIALLGGKPVDLCTDLREILRLKAIYAVHRLREPELLQSLGRNRMAGEPERGVSIHVVRAENRWAYERELTEVHRLSAVVGACGVPISGGGLVPEAEVHLLALERGGRRLVGCIQLDSTTAPSDFAATQKRPNALRSPGVMCVTGVSLAPHGRELRRLGHVAGVMMAGLQEYGIKFNIEQFVIDMAVFQLPALLELGWAPEPLGLPQQHAGGTSTLKLTVDVTETALRRTRRMLDVPGSVIVRRKLRRAMTGHGLIPRRLYH